MSDLSTLPKGDSAWLFRKAIERIMQQVSVLETNIGSSTTGNSANTQIIFNDDGTLRGDAGLVYNKTTDALTVAGLVTAGSATITGDLTVDTSTLKVDSTNDRVGIGTASPAAGAKLGVLGATSVSTSDYIGSSTYAARFIGSSNGASSGISLLTNSAGGFPAPASIHATPIADYRSAITATYSADSYGAGYFAVNRFNPTAGTTSQHYKIDETGVATWSNVGGVAGTAMTLNSTGLGVGVSPGSAIGNLQVGGSANANLYIQQGTDTVRMGVRASGRTGLLFDSSNATYTNRAWYLDNVGSSGSLIIGRQGLDVITFDNVGNVGVGVTPSAWATNRRPLQIGGLASGALALNGTGGSGELFFNSFFNSSSQNICVVNGGTGKYDFNVGTVGCHTWSVGTGTAGNAFTFTPAMTLDASGNLLVGTVTPSSLIGGSGAITARGIAGILSVNVTALSTNFTLPIGAFSGILVIRSNGGGGSAVWMLDPNAGAVSISSNIVGRTLTFTFSGGAWQLQQTVGTVPSLYNYNVIATQ